MPEGDYLIYVNLIDEDEFYCNFRLICFENLRLAF